MSFTIIMPVNTPCEGYPHAIEWESVGQVASEEEAKAAVGGIVKIGGTANYVSSIVYREAKTFLLDNIDGINRRIASYKHPTAKAS